MKLEDWFDINNITHLEAFSHLIEEGAWPKNFLPKYIEINPLISVIIYQRLGSEYLDLKIEALEQE